MKQLSIILSLFFTLLLSASCQRTANAPPKLLYLQYMNEVSPAFQNKIVNAINALNNQAGREIVALSNNGGRPLVVLNMQSNSVFAHTQYLDYECLIQIDESNNLINNQSVDQTDLKYVLLHELGHCYGYGHTTDVNNIMYPDYIGTANMTGPQVADTQDRISRFLNQLTGSIY